MIIAGVTAVKIKRTGRVERLMVICAQCKKAK